MNCRNFSAEMLITVIGTGLDLGIAAFQLNFSFSVTKNLSALKNFCTLMLEMHSVFETEILTS